MRIDIYHHRHDEEKLDRALSLLATLTTQGDKTMALIDDVNAKQDAIVTAVGTLATDQATALKDIQAEIAALQNVGGANPSQLQALSAKMDPVLDSLAALDTAMKAADPGPAPAP